MTPPPKPRLVRAYLINFSDFSFWDRLRAAWAVLRGRVFELYGSEE